MAIYFQMATLCTVGYGDISADTDSERLLMIGMMLLGASCFAVIISNISALISGMRSKEHIALENCDAVSINVFVSPQCQCVFVPCLLTWSGSMVFRMHSFIHM